MKTDLLSVIVPVYNVAEYLHRCIDSILNQTYKDIEIILIDDGSTDHSVQICDEYAAKYENIITLHKQNGGQSTARNLGIDYANGEYITFVDSDDYISDIRTYEYAMSHFISDQFTEIVAFPHKTCHEDTSKDKFFPAKVEYNNQESITITDKITALSELRAANNWNRGLITTAVWDKIYQKKIFQDIRFKSMFLEDIFIIVELIQYANQIVIESRGEYCYCFRKNSTMTGKWSENKYRDNIIATINVYQALQKYIPHSQQALQTYLNLVSSLTAFKQSYRANILNANQIKLSVPTNKPAGKYDQLRLTIIRIVGLKNYINIASSAGNLIKKLKR